MSIKTRIKKLEVEVAPQNSNICSCIRPFRFLLPGIVEGDDAHAAETHCRDCGKEKTPAREFTFKFNSNAPIMEGV